MINGIERIPSNKTYSRTTPAENDKTVLTAEWWNTISEAVETAHSKINGMTATNNASLNGTSVTIESTGTDVNITSNGDVLTNATGQITINSNDDLLLSADKSITISCGNSYDVDLKVGDDTVSLRDIIIAITNLKTANPSWFS